MVYRPKGTYTNAQATPGGAVLEPGPIATDTRKFLTVMLADTPLTALSLPLRTITLPSYAEPSRAPNDSLFSTFQRTPVLRRSLRL